MNWLETLPLVLDWLDEPGAASAVDAASAVAKERMKRWWKEVPPANR